MWTASGIVSHTLIQRLGFRNSNWRYHRGPLCCKNTPHTGGDFYCIRLPMSDEPGSHGKYNSEDEEILDVEAQKNRSV